MARKFIKKPKRRRAGQAFWDYEYSNSDTTLRLSEAPAEDLCKFLRWQARRDFPLRAGNTALELGCGNGRHLIHLAREHHLQGIGFDSSAKAVELARNAAGDLPIKVYVRDIGEPLPIEDASCHLALDMMTSHFLSRPKRVALRDEIHRVLAPGGWLCMKTFLRDEDLHTARLLRERPASEPGSYIHPIIGVPEHVYFEAELRDFLGERFLLKKIYRSHKHRLRGKARKRRTVTVYAQKDPFS